MQLEHSIAVANLIVCVGIVYLCICTLNTPTCRRSKLGRARYTVLLGGAVISGMQPLLMGSWPSPGELCLSLSVLAAMALSSIRWHYAGPQRREGDL